MQGRAWWAVLRAVLIGGCLAVQTGLAELNAKYSYTLADSEESTGLRIYSYDLDVDANGDIHTVYAQPASTSNKTTITYVKLSKGTTSSMALTTDGKYGSLSTFIIVDRSSGKVHIAYIKNQQDVQAGQTFNANTHVHLAYRTISSSGALSAETVVESGGWHTRMQLNESGRAVFVREGSSSMRLFAPTSDTSWNQRTITLPSATDYRLANFVYDTANKKYHILYGDSGNTKEVYAGKDSTSRVNGTFHKLLYAVSSDGTTWTSTTVDDTYTLYENEFWTALFLDGSGNPYAAMYSYAEDTTNQKYNTGTSLKLGRYASGSWTTTTVLGGASDSRCGMGVGMLMDSSGQFVGCWDSSPDEPIDFNGANGNIALHITSSATSWNTYRMQVRPYSAEGTCRIHVYNNQLYLMVLGNHADTKLYVSEYNMGELPEMPADATPQIPTGSFSEKRPQFAWAHVDGADKYYVEIWKDGAYYYGFWSEGDSYWWASSDFANGSYTWWVQRWVNGEGTWSDPAYFTISSSATGPSMDWPSNEITDNTPRFAWYSVSGASWYELWINKDGHTYDGSVWVSGSTSWTPTETLPDGEYVWWVRAWGSSMGYGSWSAGRRFTLDQSAPAASELKAPDDIEVQSPYMVFDWEDVPDATWYRLWINKDGAYHYDKWVQSASTWTSWWDVTSYPGSYQWWVQSYGDNGYGDWSDDTEYWVGVPGMVTEQTPVGTTVTSARPAFTWTSDSEATWYQVYLSYNGGYHWSEWVQGTNTWTPGWNMQDYPGYYEWWVQTYGANGYGPWSDGAVFVISVPGQATLSSPSGSQTSGYPTFSWSAVTGATWYQIYLEKDGVYHWSEWIEGDNSWTPWWNMNDYPGEYQWWIQTWGAAGYGPWSESLKYTMGADLQ